MHFFSVVATNEPTVVVPLFLRKTQLFSGVEGCMSLHPVSD